MQSHGASAVRIAAGDDRGSAGAAGGACKKGAIETHPFASEAGEVGGFNSLVTVRGAVVPGHVVGDDEHQVGRSGSDEDREENRCECDESEHVVIITGVAFQSDGGRVYVANR